MAKFYTPAKISENIRETPEGYLVCLGVPIARTGEMEYGPDETPIEVGEDGKVIVTRDAKEVFRAQTIASFEGKPVTIKHPQNFVSPDNWKELSKGIVQNVRKDSEKDENGEECLVADLLITDLIAIQLVKNGLREVSCGYEAEYEQTGKGKGKQTNIVGNHLALVEEGRAGSSYAINDHKGKVPMFEKLKEQLKKLSKTVDEAAEAEKKDDKAKDAEGEKKKEDKAKDAEKSEGMKVVDKEMYDELVKMVSDLAAKIDGMKGAKDDAKEKKEDEPAKDKEGEGAAEKADDAEGAEGEILERVKALEAAVAKMLEAKDDAEGEEAADDDDMSGGEAEDDAEGEEGEESQKKKTGDAARAEILAPGIKVDKKQDLKVEAIKAAYNTKDGKAVIESLTGGKAPTFDSKEKVSTLFIAASEVLKHKRGTGLEKTKDGAGHLVGDTKIEAMTPEKMNEMNAALWARK